MTNYINWLYSMTPDKFVDSMILNCDGCPVEWCNLKDTSADGGECEEVLQRWCEEEYEP